MNPPFTINRYLPIFLILATTFVALLVSVISLMSGWVTIYQNVFYIPILIACIYYTTRGFLYSILLSCMYFVLMLFFTQDPVLLEGAFIRVLFFVFVAGVIAYISSVRMRTEEALKESEEKYHSYIDNAPNGVFIANEDGDYVEVNRTACAITGYTEKELLQMRISDLLPSESYEVAAKHFQRVIETGQASGEFIFRHKDGSLRYWSVDAVKLTSTRFLGFVQDITERKRDEVALQESEARYSSLFENNYSVSLLIDPDNGMIVDANEAACWYYGFSREQLLTKGINDLNRLPKDKVVQDLQRAKNESKKHFFSTHYLASGEKRNVEVYSGPIMLQGKTLFYSIIHDITDRTRAEEALRETNAYLNNLFDYANAPIIVWDPEFRITRFNHAFERLTGRTEHEVVGQQLSLLFPEGSRDASLELIKKTLAGERWEVVEIPIQHISGEIRIVLWNSANIADPRGTIISTIAQGQDITPHKRALEALRESEEKFRSIVETSPNIIWEIDITGKFRYISPMVQAIMGYSPEEVIDGSITDLVTEQGRSFTVSELAKLISMDTLPSSIEVPARHRDGSELVLEIRPWRLTGTDGMLKGLRGIAIDITGRKRSEDALRKSRQQLAEAMDIAHLVYWEYDTGTGMFTFDDRFYALYGTTAEREGGTQMPAETYAREFIHPDDRGVVSREVGKALQATDPRYTSQVEHRIIRRDGEIRHIVVRIRITKDAEGRTIKTHGANQDITERKRAEEALQESEKRYRDFFTTSRDSVFIISPDGRWIDFNEAALEMSGYSRREDLIAQPLAELFEHPDQLTILTKLIDTNNYVKEYPVRLKRKDGSVIDTLFTSVPLREEDGTIRAFVGSIRDISERVRYENALKESNDQFLAFIKEAAMRLKNPLEVVEENITLVVGDIERGETECTNVSLQLKIQIKNLEQIRQNIIDLNKAIVDRSGELSEASIKFLIE